MPKFIISITCHERISTILILGLSWSRECILKSHRVFLRSPIAFFNPWIWELCLCQNILKYGLDIFHHLNNEQSHWSDLPVKRLVKRVTSMTTFLAEILLAITVYPDLHHLQGVGLVLSKKSYPNWRGRVIHKNNSCKKFYPEELSKKNLSKITRLN